MESRTSPEDEYPVGVLRKKLGDEGLARTLDGILMCSINSRRSLMGFGLCQYYFSDVVGFGEVTSKEREDLWKYCVEILISEGYVIATGAANNYEIQATGKGVNFYFKGGYVGAFASERTKKELSAQMLKATKGMQWATWVVAIATAINIIVAFLKQCG